MIKISLKGLAKFMTGSHVSQRKVLRDFKYPDPEGYAQAFYYREFREAVSAFHRNNYKKDWLLQKSIHLMELAKQHTAKIASRYKNNAAALKAYHQYFSGNKFEPVKDVRLAYHCNNVRISVVPDLHVKKENKEKLIKLEPGLEEPDDRVIKIITQVTFNASEQSGMGLKSSDILLFDILRGKVYKASGFSSKMSREIEAACETIELLWSKI